MADQAAVTRRRRLQPVGEVTSIRGPTRCLTGPIEKGELGQRRVGRLIEFLSGPAQRIELDRLREGLAKPGRARVVGQEDDIARLGQQVIVPTGKKLVAPHCVRPAVNQDEEGIALLFIESRREGQHTVDPFAAFAGEPEMAERLPVDPGDTLGVEAGEWPVLTALPRQVEANNLGRADRALPIGDKDRGTAAPANRERRQDTALQLQNAANLAPHRRDFEEILVACLLGEKVDDAAIWRDRHAGRGSVEALRHQDRLLDLLRPLEPREAALVIDLLRRRIDQGVEPLSVRAEEWPGITARSAGQPFGLSATALTDGHQVEVGARLGVRRGMAVG